MKMVGGNYKEIKTGEWSQLTPTVGHVCGPLLSARFYELHKAAF